MGFARIRSSPFRRSLSISCAAALALFAARARAEPLGGIDVTGQCPNQAELEAALADRGLPAGASDVRLEVHAVTGGADVRLIAANGAAVVERRLQSDDCSALADAVSVIVEAYFVELEARKAERADGSADTPAVTATEPQKSAANGAAPPADDDVVPVPPPPAAAPTASPANGPKAAPVLVLSLAGGGVVYPENASAAGVFGGSAGVILFRSFELDAVGMATTSTTLGTAPNRVSRLERRFTLRGEKWFGNFARLGLWGGFGAAVSRVELIDLPDGPRRTGWSPVAELGTGAEVPAGKHFALRLELGCHLLFDREEYTVDHGVPVGRGPRFGCSLLGAGTWRSGKP